MIKIEQAVNKTSKRIKEIQWYWLNNIIGLVHLTNKTSSTFTQYNDASNLIARINLHDLYLINKTEWFNWLHENLSLFYYDKVLEIGCGDSSLWKNQGTN